MTDDRVLVVTRSVTVPVSELQWRFTASGGPGGQHANTANTKVEVRFFVADSPSLGPRQRARLLERCGEVVAVTVSSSRSQLRNRETALERLVERLRDGLAVTPSRTATRPTAGAVRRRVEHKRRRSDTKALRQRPAADD